MEYKKAHNFLYEKSLEKNFLILADHIKTVGPLKIKLSKMNFVDHLSKIIVGQHYRSDRMLQFGRELKKY